MIDIRWKFCLNKYMFILKMIPNASFKCKSSAFNFKQH